MRVPADWLIEFTGPMRAGCSSARSETITVRPTWLVKHRGRGDGFDTVTVSFARASLTELATDEGFARVASAWFFGSDSARLAHGERWQSIEGHAIKRIDFPHAARGEPSYAFDIVFVAVARFELENGCALVLRVREVGHVNDDESVAGLWPGVEVLRGRSKLR
jgi:hypothetical protein